MNTPRAAQIPRFRLPVGWEAVALGLLGVGLFALSPPMTRLAVGSSQQPQLSPEFVALGRAAVAGVLAALWLLVQRAAWPQPRSALFFSRGACRCMPRLQRFSPTRKRRAAPSFLVPLGGRVGEPTLGALRER